MINFGAVGATTIQNAENNGHMPKTIMLTIFYNLATEETRLAQIQLADFVYQGIMADNENKTVREHYAYYNGVQYLPASFKIWSINESSFLWVVKALYFYLCYEKLSIER